MSHSKFSVLCVGSSSEKASWLNYLAYTPASVELCAQLPADLKSYKVVVLDPAQLQPDDLIRLTKYVTNGGSCLGLVSSPSSSDIMVRLFGVSTADPGPNCEVRILFTDQGSPNHSHHLSVRLPDAFYTTGVFMPLDVMEENVEVILYADWQYSHRPMLTLQSVGDGLSAATTIMDFNQTIFQRVLYRLLRHLAGFPYPENTLGVGLLGYPKSVGDIHAQAAYQGTPGLKLKTICDLKPARRNAAIEIYDLHDVKIITEAEMLQDDPEVDIVIIATPPKSHANLAMQMLESGKNVVIEKPLALTTAETKALIEKAEFNNLLLCCHQNRRWDDDYRAIKQALENGLVGDVFYLETFIGGYGHPCGYWHSDEDVSGGTAFDWGAHYLDWIMDLMPGTISEIISFRHKRVWYDITNADQEQIILKFTDGRQAEFLHSDLAFIPKPKWYLLGTSGSIVGDWREVTIYNDDPLVYYRSHHVPPAELGADLRVRRLQASGQIIEQSLPIPTKLKFPFHYNLSDHLLLGEPLAVSIDHTARVIDALETAKISADNGGTLEKVRI